MTSSRRFAGVAKFYFFVLDRGQFVVRAPPARRFFIFSESLGLEVKGGSVVARHMTLSRWFAGVAAKFLLFFSWK